MTRGRNIFLIILNVTMISILVGKYIGCRNNDPVGPGGNHDSAKYGKGSMSFDATDAGGYFAASGKYIPSDQFADDSLSQGAGGFVYDTSIAGKPLRARFAGYTQRLTHGMLNERLIVFTLYDSLGPLSAGDYVFDLSDTASSGKFAEVNFLFFSDSLSQYSVFEGKNGTLTLSLFNTASNHVQGTFSGTLQGVPPDTSIHIQISNGLFDITFVKQYFNY